MPRANAKFDPETILRLGIKTRAPNTLFTVSCIQPSAPLRRGSKPTFLLAWLGTSGRTVFAGALVALLAPAPWAIGAGRHVPQLHVIAGGSFIGLSIVSLRQGDGLRSRDVWIDDGCAVETVVRGGKG